MHKWHGFRELEQNLKQIGEAARERGVKRMMHRAAVPMRDDAKRRAPVLKEPDPRRRAGTVRDRIRIWRKKGTQFAVTYYVGVLGISRSAISKFKAAGGKGTKGSDNPNDPFYWRWVELGKPNMAAQPFLRPSFESKKMESVRVALHEGREFLRREARRLKRLAKRS